MLCEIMLRKAPDAYSFFRPCGTFDQAQSRESAYASSVLGVTIFYICDPVSLASHHSRLAACRFQKLDSRVPVMQSAQDCICDDVPEGLDRASVYCLVHPSQAKHEDATHYNRRRTSQGSAAGALR